MTRKLASVEGPKETVEPIIKSFCDFMVHESNWKQLAKSSFHLGRGCDMAGYGAYERINPELLASMAGLLERNGVLLLGVESLEALADSSRFHDEDALRYKTDRKTPVFNNYLKRLVRLIDSWPEVIRIDSDWTGRISELAMEARKAGWMDRTQRSPVVALPRELREFAENREIRVLLLTGVRGGGKSTRLALLTERLLDEGYRVLLTGAGTSADRKILEANPSLEFTAFDQLPEKPSADTVVIIDEAASVPLPRLKALADSGCRLLLSGTIEGYEGTGGGLRLKFLPYLKEKGIRSGYCHLDTSFRFDDDAFGRLWRQIFSPCRSALDTPLDSAEDSGGDQIAKTEILQFSPEDLLSDETLLAQVYELLTDAHYRTSPSDLRQILDSPSSVIFALKAGPENCDPQKMRLCAVLWAVREQMKESLVPEVFMNRRRPRGNLLPQTLVAHGGFRNAGYYRFLRILRIAVDESCRRQGLASRLIRHMEQTLAEDTDFFGVSFGAAAELLRFWRSLDYIPVKLGLKEDASSGLFSAVMLKTTGVLKSQVLAEWHDTFVCEFLHTACWLHQDLPAEAALLALNAPVQKLPPDGRYIRDLQSLALGLRNPEQAVSATLRWITENPAIWSLWKPQQARMLIEHFVLHRAGKERKALEETVSMLRQSMLATLNELQK